MVRAGRMARAGRAGPRGHGGANRRAGRTGEPGGASGVGEAGEPDGVNDAVIPPTGADGRAEPDPTLRSVYVDAPRRRGGRCLHPLRRRRGRPGPDGDGRGRPLDGARARRPRRRSPQFMLQPLSERATVIHGLLAAWAPRIVPVSESAAVSASALASPPRHPPSSAFASAPASAGGHAFTSDRLAVLRRHDAALGAVRDAAEKQARP